jgi:autotransporter-associated beta strand protein
MGPPPRPCLAFTLVCSLLLAMSPTPPAHAQEVIINEFMSSNSTTLADEDGAFEDWIEIYNPTSETVDLTSWGLSDNLSSPFKWTFAPGTIIAPGTHLLVWASGKDRPGQQLLSTAPDQIDGLVTWLRADAASFAHGSPVATWTDSSGLDNHATQPLASQRPTFTTDAINGLPALSFDRSANQQLFLPTAGFAGMEDLSNFTFLAVTRWTGGVTSGLFGGFRGNNNTNSGSVVFEINSGGSLRLRVPNSINLSTNNAVTQGQWQILGAAMDKPAAIARTFVDGQAIADADGTAALTLLANFERLPIGSSHDDLRTFGGQIAELALFNRALSPLERAALESHWAAKYDLPPLAHDLTTPPHTNFRISAEGEPIILTRPDGSTADQVGPVALPADVSYGRSLADPALWDILAVPTPGAANDSPPWQEPTPPVTFSHPSGFHAQPFSLALGHPDPSAQIIYTLDGSEPDISKLSGATYQFRTSYNSGPLVQQSYQSLAYSSPIPVADRSEEPNKISLIASTSDSNPSYLPAAPVKKATVVRARAYADGLPGPVSTSTFFVSATGAFDYDIPLVSLSFDEDGFFDYHHGIYVAGVDHVTSTGGRICNWGNFNRRGTEAEQAGHFQYFEGGTLAIDQGVGFRIHGNCSRRNAFKSLRIHAGRSYDPLGRAEIDHALFPSPPPDATVPGNTAHRRLILRSPSINEVAFCRLYQPVYGGVGGRLRPVVKFFNGEYWGISYLRDRLDQHYLARHYDLDPANIVLVNIKYGHEVGSSDLRVFDLDAGIPSDMDDFWAMRQFITSNNMANAANYEQALSLLDSSSFIDHLILKIFAGDDHYAPEYVFWRARDPEDASFGDGRWRVMVKDFDSTLLTANYVAGLANGTHPRPFGFELFQSLLANPSFRHDFINRFADLLNAHFQPARFQAIIDAAHDEVAPIWGEMGARWNNAAFSNPNRPFTTTHRDNLISWSNDHPPRQRTHIRSHFGISSNVDLTVAVSDPAHGHVRVNTIDITGDTPGLLAQPYPWTGVYFHNIPVKLSAIPAAGYRFAGWRKDGSPTLHSPDPEFTASLATATTFEASFEPATLIHQWDFESTTAFLEPSTSVGGAALASSPGATTAILRNTAAQDFPTAHLRVNDPLGASLTWSLPSTGFAALSLSWETRRSSQGAGTQSVEISTDGVAWQSLATYPVFDAAPQPHSFELSGFAHAANNPLLALRVSFAQGEGGSSGNNRFDNVTLTGIPLPGGAPPASLAFQSTPIGTSSGTTLAPVVVRLLDADGNPAVSYNGPVTLSLAGPGSLSGTLTVDASNGTATFEGIVLTGSGSHQLVAQAGGLAPATSATFQSLSLAALVVPRFIQGGQDAGGENNDRVPFAWLARIDGLLPGATYRFANRAVSPADPAASDGAGNMVFVTGQAEVWVRTTSSPRFRPEDLGSRHFTFTADAAGSFAGWFVTEPTGNARFTPGNAVHLRLLLNDGGGGEAIAHVLTTTESAQAIRFGTSADEGTAIIGESSSPARHLALLYDEAEGTSRPLAATPVEVTGAEVDARYAAFYQGLVATSQGHWGSILPNSLPGGLRRIEIREATGEAATLDTRAAAGGFPGTVDPDGGLAAPIMLDADAGLPVFLPGGNGTWHSAANWLGGTIPDAPGARAIVNAPASADRNVNVNAPATIGGLRANQGNTSFLNRVRNNHANGTLTFDGGDAQPATLHVEGAGGTGHVDLDFSNPVTLATDLILLVNHPDGDPQHGALRLQQAWSGPGGLIKQGPGVATLSGEGKSFTGHVTVAQGVLRLTGPAVPAAAGGISVLPGGQLRLVSAGTFEQPRDYPLPTPITLAGPGRSGVGAGAGLGVLGALRYEPGAADSRATIPTPIALAAEASIHVAGTTSQLDLTGPLSGSQALAKSGGGTLRIAADSPDFDAPIAVDAGSVMLAAHLAAPIHLAAQAALSGHGSCGAISGQGALVLARTTLAAPDLDGPDAHFIFSAHSPDFSSPQSAANGTLIASSATPSSVSIYLDAPDLSPGDRFQGGLAMPVGSGWSTVLARLTVYHLDPAGAHHFDGRTWAALGTTLAAAVPAQVHGLPAEILEVFVTDGPTSFAAWQAAAFPHPADLANPLVSGPAAAPFGDGIANLLRYASGVPGTAQAAALLPSTPPGPAAAPGLRLRLNPLLPDIRYQVLASHVLDAWHEADIIFDSASSPHPPLEPGGWVTVLDPHPHHPRRFYSARILYLPPTPTP